jgi:hypothetical protein
MQGRVVGPALTAAALAAMAENARRTQAATDSRSTGMRPINSLPRPTCYRPFFGNRFTEPDAGAAVFFRGGWNWVCFVMRSFWPSEPGYRFKPLNNRSIF